MDIVEVHDGEKSVLIFPPLVGQLRHLTHKFIDNFYCPHLCSFSIGQEDQRRIIIGLTDKLIRCSLPYTCIHEKLLSISKDSGKPTPCICPRRINLLLAKDIAFAKYMSSYQQSRVAKSEDVEKKIPERKEKSTSLRYRHKRPDKQLYVPRALRKSDIEYEVDKDSLSTIDKTSMQTSSLQTTCVVPKIKKQENSNPILPKYPNVMKDTNNIKDSEIKNSNIDDIFNDKRKNVSQSQTTENCTMVRTEDIVVEKNNMCSIQTVEDPVVKQTMNCASGDNFHMNLNDNEQCIKESHIFSIDMELEDKSNEKSSNNKTDSETVANVLAESGDKSNEKNHIKISSENAENDITLDKISVEETVMPPNNVKNTEIKIEANLCDRVNVKIDDEPASENNEDSWETMFNDDGDCLDPKFIKELCDVTGQIDLTIAKSDYSSYKPVSRDASGEFENVVELYGFPIEFSTQDLTSAFSAFQEASYIIKWVDDTHALAIFSSPAIAYQALDLSHPFIKVRPVSEGIKESKAKARFCARLEAQKPRPVTSALLARRLVTGALGLKVNASKEQRDIERKLLKEAKEKKKLKARQRQDIWNGIVT